MSIIYGPGVGPPPPVNVKADKLPADLQPIVIQLLPGQTLDAVQIVDSNSNLLAHCDSTGVWRGVGFTGLGTPFNAGFSTIQMTADANLTPNSVQTQSGILNFTSSVSLTATRTITLPLVAGASYGVINGTTGGQSLTLQGISGTGVTITNGARADIYCDGTNWLRITEDFTNTGHEVFASFTAPTAAAGANAGTSPPAPVVTAGDTDMRGNITFGTGTSPGAGQQVVVTYANAWAIAPTVMVIPKNTATQALGLYVSSNTTTGFTLSCTTAPAASQANTTYSFDYQVIG